MKKVAFYTLGCKVNQYETEAMSEIFEKEGYQVVDFDDGADVYVINTCTVTGLSARKSRQMIRRAKNSNKDSIVAVVGCYSQTAPDEAASIPGVNLVVGTSERARIVDYVRQVERNKEPLNVVGDIMKIREFEELTVGTYKEHTRAVLKIQEGCSQFCAYCIIPYARGPVRSRKPDDVTDEVRALARKGFKEIVLTGIHLASYGKDMGKPCLLEIIKRIHDVDGVERIRLGSLEPTIITDGFVQNAAQLDKLCPHYHISLQSGCNDTLKRMNRKYTSEEYRDAVLQLRRHIPDAAVTTDVMVGFPGETETEFERTYRFLDEISFAKMHVFKYSPRRGTPAASFANQVSPQVKEERSERLLSLSNSKMLEFNGKFTGRTMPVLFEQQVKAMDGYVEGLTPNYIRVVCRGGADLEGKILDVRMNRPEVDYVVGEVL